MKGLIDRNNLVDIANAIRDKTGENGLFYPSEMADKILSIETGGGGLDLVTSLSFNVDKTATYDESIIATAILMADYDDLTPSDIDLKGYLKNATVLFYDSDDNLLGTAITNENGVAVCDLVLDEATTIHCVFNGTSDYNSCSSESIYIDKYVLPTEYQKVDYIQGTGTQYIELDYVLQAHDIVEGTVDIQRSGSQYGFIFGARRISANYNCYGLFSKFGGYNRFNYARTRNEASGNIHELDTKYSFKTENNTCTISKDNVIVDTITSSGTIENCINNCGVFCANTSSNSTSFSPDSISNMKLYNFKIFSENNEYIRYLVPVYRKSDNVVGLYDLITNNFYTNEGTGEFIIPPIIIYEDKCDSDVNINHYVESSIQSRINIPSHASITYDSTENAYKLVGQSPYFVMEEIPELNGIDDYVISADMKVNNTSGFNQIGFGIYEYGDTNHTYLYCIRGDNKVQILYDNFSQEDTIYSNSTSNIWFTMKVTKQGNNFNLELFKDGNTINTYNWTIPTFTNTRCGFIKQTEQSYQISYIKNIKVEKI